MPIVEKCGCPESEHLRRAIQKIAYICDFRAKGITKGDMLKQISALALNGVMLEPLLGDPLLQTKVPR